VPIRHENAAKTPENVTFRELDVVVSRLHSRMSMTKQPWTVARLARLARAGIAGVAATLVDLAVLALLVTGMHVDARAASIPALLAGGIANFVGNRHFAFRAREGNVWRQALLYALVEVMALAFNGLLYDNVLRTWPVATHLYWAVRLATSHAVFLVWSYPLWKRVFAVRNGEPKGEASTRSSSANAAAANSTSAIHAASASTR
jgi:putative flippase GtrA